MAKRDLPRTCPDMSSGRYTQSDSTDGRIIMVRRRLGVVDETGAHWRNLANAIEPSVCGGDAALCQITLK